RACVRIPAADPARQGGGDGFDRVVRIGQPRPPQSFHQLRAAAAFRLAGTGRRRARLVRACAEPFHRGAPVAVAAHAYAVAAPRLGLRVADPGARRSAAGAARLSRNVLNRRKAPGGTMSWQECEESTATAAGCPAIESRLVSRARDLGGFEVRRVLPTAARMMVGPFIFWDQMGLARFAPGVGLDVRPHPHIGLATVTYLFRGL